MSEGTAVRAPEPEFAGTARFEIRKLLGAGGMGAVYQAFDRERRVEVALKTLLALTPEGLLRFKEEFRALQDLNLSHPNLVGIGELFNEGRDWFFTMELVDGVEFLRHVRVPRRNARPDGFVNAPTVLRTPQEEEVAAPVQPASGRFDEGRLRACLPQLVAGLDALHASGKVHRDVKPSNILVTREGRVVLLDFGLLTDFERRKQISHNNIVGTVEYMAPEQAAGDPIGPPADWYALGVVLYEALTGIVPFVGTALEVLTNKQQLVPQAPRTMLPDVPRDLDALCCQLLRIDPRQRPDAARIYQALGIRSPRPLSSNLSAPSGGSSIFLGREVELGTLRRAYEQTRLGEARTVYVSGESGVGKTALVRRFTDLLEITDPDVAIREGRCYERETVPYKAVDSLIDDLSLQLMRMPKDEVRALLPSNVGLLAQVFPVLRRVEPVAEAPQDSESAPRSAHELRSRLFATLREFFTNLGRAMPLVLVINDLQWADADSIAMLAEIMRPPAAPPLLLVCTIRTSEDAMSLDRLQREIAGEVIEVRRLGQDEARELAGLLLRRIGSGSGIVPDQVASEAGGHPLFIDELIRYAHLHGVPATGSVQLEDALWERVSRIDERSRRLMEVVALAAAPLPQQTAAQAAEIDLGEFPVHAKTLRAASLVRTSGTRQTDTIEPYHDRVRSAVRGHVSTESARALHRRIALALETTGNDDPAALALHWVEAGDRDKAFQFGLRAAERADQALAFDRAARFYETCLANAPPGAELDGLRVKLANALANAGRGAEAAAEFARAADALVPKAGTEGEVLELRRCAADQYLRSGRIDEGLASIRAVLAAYGWQLPKPSWAIASLLFQRARVRIGGLGFKERSEREIPRADLQRIDICWSIAAGLGAVDSVVGADFQARHLLLALKAGEPYRVVRALAMEVVYTAGPGHSSARTAELLALTRRIAERHRHPHGLGLLAWTEGSSAFMEGRWPDGHALCVKAEKILRDECTGVSWELDTARFLSLWCAFYRGDLLDVQARVPVLLREAESRGDSFAVTNYRTAFMPFLRLVEDDCEGAKAEALEGLARWSRQGFFVQHYNALFARVMAHLYEDRVDLAEGLVTEAWPAMEAAKVFIIQQMKIRAYHQRGCIRLSAAVPPRQRHYLKLAEEDARQLEKEAVPWALALAQLLRAGIRRSAGDLDGARRGLEQAVASLDSAGMLLYAAAARRHLGRLRADSEGRAQVALADEFFRSQRVRNPARLSAILAPGYPD